MYCVYCGYKVISTSARFCYQCGKELLHNNSDIIIENSEQTQEKVSTKEFSATEHCEEKIEQTDYRIQLLKAEHRKIINLSAARLSRYIPTLKQVLYTKQKGKYWVVIKIGQLRGDEAFKLLYFPYNDFNGEEYLGYCVDLYATDTENKLTDYLLLLVEKDNCGIQFIKTDAIDMIKQTSKLAIFWHVLTMTSLIISLFGLWILGLRTGLSIMAITLLPATLLWALASNLPFKKGKII